MINSNQTNLEHHIITALLTIGVILVILLVCSVLFKNMDNQITYIQCCNNQTCSDTYYDADTNLCHLSMCESSVFTDKSKCVYPGLNLSLTGI